MVPRDADNVVAAGRCVDADVSALSAIRVMGPCIAMGTAAAHALDLAGTKSVHDIDSPCFRRASQITSIDGDVRLHRVGDVARLLRLVVHVLLDLL